MPTTEELIEAMRPMPETLPVVLEPDQDVSDIMRFMPWKHKKCRAYYDRIYEFFDEESVEGIAENIWQFLKGNISYFEEPDKDQRLSTPLTILERGYCDCKGYALFSGGVIDAMNRAGASMPWCYRFVPSTFMGTRIGHVFVVLDPGGDEVWIDPVLTRFDEDQMYVVREDRYVGEPEGISGLAVSKYGRIGLSQPEQNLLDQLNEYTLGVQDAISVSLGNSTLNAISKGVLQTAEAAVPGLAQAESLYAATQSQLDNDFGPGSFAARLFADSNNNVLMAPIAIVQTLLNPGARTFESDQYYGATYYYYYVQGQAKYNNAPQQVSDQQVIPALKWFIDRLGVFISGREHIEALVQGAQQYLRLYSVNHYTTTDLGKVNAAVSVAQRYFNFQGEPGSWANTIGVFDPALVALAMQLGESVEHVASQVQSGQIASPVPWWKGILSSPWTWLGAGAILLLLLTHKKGKNAGT